MSAAATMLLVGTVGFFVLVTYGAWWLRRWPRCVRTLAVVLLVTNVFWGFMRLVLQSGTISAMDMLIVNGSAPWIAFVYLASYKHDLRRRA